VVSLDFSVTYSFHPYYGPGVESAPSENEYQEYFLSPTRKERSYSDGRFWCSYILFV